MNKNLLVFLIIILVVGTVAIGAIWVSSFSRCGSWAISEKCATELLPELVPGKGLVVLSPQPNEEISSPVKITGYANGSGWAGFEGQVGSVKLLVDGIILAQEPLTAQGDWMVSGPVDFEANLIFQVSEDKTGTLVFSNENPSGDPERGKEFILPVRIEYRGTQAVNVYFNNSNLDPEASCNKVFSVSREMPKTQAVARAALEGLLSGPTVSEKNQGYFTSINPGVKIQSLAIENGTARVDFDEQLEFQVGGSCRVSAIRAQITETLKQFSTVENVIISINGRTEDILQP